MLQPTPDGASRSHSRDASSCESEPLRSAAMAGTGGDAPAAGSDAARLDALLPALRQRDRDAFHELYDLMAGPLTAFCHGLLGDRGDAEDAVQDVFLRFSKHAKRFRGDGRSLLAWLYTTARRRCSDRRRWRARRPERLVDVVPDRPLVVVDDPAGTTGFDPEVEAALAQLTEAQRTAIVLRRVVGYDGDEVGAVMGIDREAVYALCRRGETRLRTLLADPSDGGPDGRLEG